MKRKFLTVDFETYYDKQYSLSKMGTEEYVRDPRFQIIGVGVKEANGPTTWWSGTHDYIREVLLAHGAQGCIFLAHHTKFDGAILEWVLGIRAYQYLDTLSMARPVHGLTGQHSLAWLAEHYGLGVKGTEVVQALGKRLEDFDAVSLAQYGGYCCNDVELTLKLFGKLRAHVPPGELLVIDIMLRMFIRPAFMLDVPLLEEHLDRVRARKEALLEKVTQHACADVLASNPKFAEVLREVGVEPPMKLSPAALKRGEEVMTYAFSKGDVAFKALLEHPNPDVQALVSARLGVKSTLEETRTLRFIDMAARGPMPVPLRYYGAHTGRASGEEGFNMQNLPRGGALRKSLAAPPGHMVVTCDSAQIEARVVAYLAGQTDLVQDFRDKKDIYSLFASDIYGTKVDRKLKEIGPDGKEFYPFELEGRVGKEGILGLGFGMGHEKFQTRLKVAAKVDMPLEKCNDIVELYRAKYDKIRAFWGSCKTMLDNMIRGYDGEVGVGMQLKYEPGKVWLPNGMSVQYPELRREKKGFSYRAKKGRTWETVYIYGGKVTENLVQAVARVIVFEQMVVVDRLLRERMAERGGLYQLVLTVHDEVVAIVPEDDVEWATKMMLDVMFTPPAWAPDLPIAAEAESGRSYGDAK